MSRMSASTCDHHREGEADLHARGVVLELEVLELAQLGEVEDRVVALARLVGREAQHDAVDDDVVVRGQVGVEADAEFDERRQRARGARSRPRPRGRCRRGIFMSVLLPLPLRPTMPKNSPVRTSTETSRSACRRSAPRAQGWTTRSFSVWTCSWGRRKALLTPRISMRLGDRWSDRPGARLGARAQSARAPTERRSDRAQVSLRRASLRHRLVHGSRVRTCRRH